MMTKQMSNLMLLFFSVVSYYCMFWVFFLNKYLWGNLSKWTYTSVTHTYEKWVSEQVEMTAERSSGSGARIQFRGNKCHRSDSEHHQLREKKKKNDRPLEGNDSLPRDALALAANAFLEV